MDSPPSCLRAVLGEAKVIHMYAPFHPESAGRWRTLAAQWLLQPTSRRERLIRRFRLAISDIRHEYQAGQLMGQASQNACRSR